MKEPADLTGFEPRWPAALTIVAVAALLMALPRRLQLFPFWTPLAIGLVVLAPIVAVGLTRADARARWSRIERRVTLLFGGLIAAGTVANLANLIREMVSRSAEITGVQLLTASIAVWVSNVLAFALIYWQVDRGGPAVRAGGAPPRPDWLFPQESAPPEDVAPDWRPEFVDYLCLGYATATAFSPTDALPLTARAKLLMMIQSAIALATIVVVASRAINILGN